MREPVLPKRQIELSRAKHPGWDCPHCHWRNNTINKHCGNCGHSRKEPTCPTQEHTTPDPESADPQN